MDRAIEMVRAWCGKRVNRDGVVEFYAVDQGRSRLHTWHRPIIVPPDTIGNGVEDRGVVHMGKSVACPRDAQ